MLGIARYHRDHNGWNDIGYNFLVDQYGQIFEGRAGGIDQAIVGAQAQGYNSVSTGVACLGTFTDVAQTEPGMEALAQLIGWKLPLHGVPVHRRRSRVTSAGGETNRYPAGHAGHVRAHLRPPRRRRDGCPGDVALRPARRPAHARRPLCHAPARGAHDPGELHDRAGRRAPTTLSGELRFGDGSSPAGARVQVLYSAGGGRAPWSPPRVCARTARWSTDLDAPRDGHRPRAVPGDATRPRLESPLLDITVSPSSSSRSTAATCAAGASSRSAASSIRPPTA